MYKYFKEAAGWLLALFGVVIISPALFIIAAAIKIDSKGPAVFRQERIGRDMKSFMLYKFRTMKRTDVKFDINKPVIKDDNMNLTRVGKIIRKIKFDEFLQLFNVLRGEMTLIGPRPLMPVYLEQYEKWELEKFSVKPGLSGLSQIRGNGHLNSKERSYYDVKYAREMSFKLDLEILFKTVGVLILGEEKFLSPVPKSEIELLRRESAESTKRA